MLLHGNRTLQRIIFGDELINLTSQYDTFRDRFGNDHTNQSFTIVFFFADLPKDVMKISGDRELNVSLYRHWTLFKVIPRFKISLQWKNVQIKAAKTVFKPNYFTSI
jgi:hypothetical protein